MRLHIAGSQAQQRNRSARDRTLRAVRHERYRQPRRRACTHIERWISDDVIGQRVEGDRLIGLVDVERTRYVRRGVEAGIAGLMRRDRTTAEADERDGAARDRARRTARRESHRQIGRGRGRDPEWRIDDGVIGQRVEGDRLIKFAGGVALVKADVEARAEWARSI